MDPSEGGDLERVFAICDTDGDGLLSKEELESILKDIGVEIADINEFMWGLQSEEFITYPQFVFAIEKFRQASSGSTLSLHGSRVSPRSQAGSAAGGDHTECNFTIHDLNSKNSVLSKQVYSLEAQIHELVLHTQDQERNEKLQSKELRKLQAKFSSVSAELEVLKQVNKDLSTKESDLKRQLKQSQDSRNSMELDLQSARTQLDAVRSGEDALRDARVVSDAGISQETQAEIDRLSEALERNESEVQQLLRANEELLRLRRDDEYQIKVLDARIERLNLELENKENLYAELGLVTAGQGDKLGKTWHGFEVSPLCSELGQIDDQPMHPSLVDERNLQIIGKNSLDSAFLKEKVANINEEIRRNAPPHKHISGPIANQSYEAENEVFSSSLSESDRVDSQGEAEKISDEYDILANHLMNLSDLVITTSDITHECTSPTYQNRDSSSTPSAEKDSSTTTPIPGSDAAMETEDGDADGENESERESEQDSERERDKEGVSGENHKPIPQHFIGRATTPTASHKYGVSPDEAHYAKEIQKHGDSDRKNVAEQPNGKTPRRNQSEDTVTQHTTPRNGTSNDPSPRSSDYATPLSHRTPRSTPRRNEDLASSRSAPSTFRADDSEVTPMKSIKHSKSEVIRTKSEATPVKHDLITPAKTPSRRPELVRHKSEVSLSPTNKLLVTPDQVNELHEFALRAGLIRPRPLDFGQRADKYAQVDPADLDEAQVLRSRSQRSVTSSPSPHSAHSTNTQTPHSAKTATSRSARSVRTPASGHANEHHVDRKIMVRGHSYLVRLLAHPDPALDDLEDIVKKLEAELVSIEERFNRPSTSFGPLTSSASSTSSTPASSSSSNTASTTTSTPVNPSTPTKGVTPRTPRAPGASLSPSPSSHHPSFANRRTLRPSPLVTSRSYKNESRFKNWRFWVVALVVVVLSILLVAFIVSSKLQDSPNILPSNQQESRMKVEL